MKLLGHSDIRLVVRCYAHLSPDFLADTVRLHFPRFMGGGRSAPREWSEAATALRRPRAKTTASLLAASSDPSVPKSLRRTPGYFAGDPTYANPAATAAQRWAALQRRTPPGRLTYEHLAGKL